MSKLNVLSPAKINLILEIIGKRNDGFHEIRSLIQTVGLFDEITYEDSNQCEFFCNDSILQNDDNLVIQAIRIYKKETGEHRNVSVSLTKHIPSSAGLGGGSSNAATTLLALNRLWGGVASTELLLRIASQIGSDVPFFLMGGLALIEGRGEIVRQLPEIGQYWIVLMIPALTPVSNKTRKLYSMLKPSHYSRNHLSNDLISKLKQTKMIDFGSFFNTFDFIAFNAFPGIDRYWNLLERSGARNVHLCGSGPSLFSICTDRKEAETIGSALKESGIIFHIIPTVHEHGLISA